MEEVNHVHEEHKPHEHHGHHHDHVKVLSSLSNIFIICIVLNVIYVFIEASVGFFENSLGLLSDAGHNLGDVFSLLLALIALHLAKISNNKRFTYGYKKSTILISLLNAIILLVAVGAIVVESINKLRNPEPIDGSVISWTAGAGIIVNGLTTLLLMKSQKHDLNVRGAFLHMAADTLVSVGVVVSGLVIMYTGFYLIDPIISLVIAGIILISTIHLLMESLRLSLDGVPETIRIEEVKEVLEAQPHVLNVHHLHIWAISTTDVALTAHVVIDDLSGMEDVKDALKTVLREKGINHSTLEMESTGTHCHESSLIINSNEGK